jgi:hypothetical protein
MFRFHKIRNVPSQTVFLCVKYAVYNTVWHKT